LTVEEFGEKLITTGDLDPIYIALHQCKLYPHRLNRWLLAYLCFYHAGFACYASEHHGADFWRTLMTAAQNVTPAPNGGRWPRASERRHFRAKQAIRAIQELSERHPDPETWIPAIALEAERTGEITVEQVFTNVKSYRGFGDWAAFKMADLLAQVCGYRVTFSNAAVFMFESPVEGSIMVAKSWDWFVTCSTPEQVSAELIQKFGHLKAAPDYSRPINIQEVETVLCKWKSHVKGKYAVGHDIEEIRHGMKDWLFSPTAKVFFDKIPALPQDAA